MKKIIIALLGIAIVMPSVFAATIYVSPNGNDANSGATWELAKQSVQNGMNAANEGDTVLVTNGTYFLSYQITVAKTITLKSVNGASVTVVDGSYMDRDWWCFELQCPGGTNAIIDGFTITGGRRGGIVNSGTVKNCMISGNGNISPGQGGGILNFGMVQNCTISGNSASLGGGVCGGTLKNCTVVGNSASVGGGVYCQYDTGPIHPSVQNCVMYDNENGDFNGNIVPQYSCAPGLSGNGNISSDPQFEDSANGNYRLKSTSPCINAGLNQDWMANAVDLDGNPRICYGRVDMGAYEFAIKNSTNICPVIKANGQTNNVTVNYSSNLTITVQIDPGQYQGAPVNWWVVALAKSSWYYLNSAIQWTPFDGNLSNCHPAYQGALVNLPETTVLNMTGLPVGSYTFWFAVNYPMNGILNINEPILVDVVGVTIQ